MRTFAQKPKAPQQATPAKPTRPARSHFGQSPEVNSILHLQRTIGNQALQRMLQTHVEKSEARSTAAAPPRFAHDFSRIPAHSHAGIQPKLMVNTPGDIYEQEADRVADQVMRMPEPQLQRACACGGACPRCQTEQPEHRHERLQTLRIGSSELGKTAVPPNVDEALRSAGQPLDPSARAFMQSRFGHDFSQVRVRADARAGDSARALGARAYTVGQNIVFAPEEYAPGTAEGRRLLAHELTHVVQQSFPGDNSKSVAMRQPKPVETKFSSCTGNQSNQINAAVQNAKKALNRATSVVGTTYGNPSKVSATNRQLLMDHFHTTSHDDLRDILGTYISVGRAFDSGLKFQCETTCPKTATSVVCGYAYNTMWFGGIGPIHICFDTAGGCDFSTTPANNQVALVIHEAAHRHAGVDDKMYQWERGYATLSAKDAMDNADSYAWFAVLV